VLNDLASKYVRPFLESVEPSAQMRASAMAMLLNTFIGRSSFDDLLWWCLRPVFQDRIRMAFSGVGPTNRYPMYFTRGTNALAQRIEHFGEVAERLTANESDELDFLRHVAAGRSERTDLIGFGGSTRFYTTRSNGREDLAAELDGLVIFTNREEPCVIVTEAKDHAKGSASSAARQLREKVLPHLAPDFVGSIETESGRGASLVISPN